MMDAFGSLFSVPFQLTTREAVEHIHRILNDRGVVVFNLGSAIEGPASSFLQAEFRTYKDVFPNVYLFKVRPERDNSDLQNLIVVACKSACVPSETTGDAFFDSLLARLYTAPVRIEKPILTDELAPVERYGSIAQSFAR
jgi:spermidine synthase